VTSQGSEGIKHITDIAMKENLPLQVIHLDVNDDKSVTDAISRILRKRGGLLKIWELLTESGGIHQIRYSSTCCGRKKCL
jgi:hypothetical protein